MPKRGRETFYVVLFFYDLIMKFIDHFSSYFSPRLENGNNNFLSLCVLETTSLIFAGHISCPLLRFYRVHLYTSYIYLLIVYSRRPFLAINPAKYSALPI